MKKNILITWISSWIWKHLAENLKNESNIYWISRTNPNIEDINYTSVDISDFWALKVYLNSVDWTQLDTIILNAWIWFFDEIQNLWETEILSTINTNLTANILIINSLVSKLQKECKIIFIWSVASKKFFKHWSVYQASKFWLRWFAWSLRNEIKQKVYHLNPQFVDTKNFFKNYRVWVEWRFNETNIDDILTIVKNIIDWNENRFEIDF